MPRFTELERERIQGKLLTEGEKLFLSFGLKKVTIDELADAAGIAKATFYVFYDSKEQLFLSIAEDRQRELFRRLNAVLDASGGLPDRQRVRQIFVVMQESLSHYPILNKIDIDTVERIARKVPQERLGALMRQNIDAAKSLHEHGVRFSCDIETASWAFQALYHSWMFMSERSPDQAGAVISIMLDGIIDQIIPE